MNSLKASRTVWSRWTVLAVAVSFQFGCAGKSGESSPSVTVIGDPPPVVHCSQEPCVKQLAAGADACVALADGTVRCWGGNALGESGGVAGNPVLQPSLVPIPEQVAQVIAGPGTACALGKSRAAWCWGNTSGVDLKTKSFDPYVGPGLYVTSSSHPVPAQLTSGNTVQVGSGAYFDCALDTQGVVSCLGADDTGMLGHGVESHSSRLQPIPNITAVSLIVGWGGGCAKLADDTFTCWGDAADAQYAVPHAVPELTGTAQLRVSVKLSCALNGSGEVACWEDYHGASPSPLAWPPTAIAGLDNVSSISVYGDTACAVLSDGTVSCWGSNQYGELGQGTADSDVHWSPVAVPGVSGAVSVAVGQQFACALGGDGGIACWGSNDHGQLGLGESDDEIHSPGPVLW